MESCNQFQSLSIVLIREILPVVKFSEVADPPETYTVCLYEFEAGDEIRLLTNCHHIFHRCCLDWWMDHDDQFKRPALSTFVGLRPDFSTMILRLPRMVVAGGLREQRVAAGGAFVLILRLRSNPNQIYKDIAVTEPYTPRY